MKIKKLSILILILIMITSLVLIVVSCAPEEDLGIDKPGDNTSGAIPDPIVINKGAVYEDISDGLLNAGIQKTEQTTGKRYVSSNYSLIVNTINTELTYEANYDMARSQDSEILLRVFDYHNQVDKLFVYYKDATLYYSIDGSKNRIDDFGGSSSFPIFYEIITSFDFGDTLFSEETVATITGMNPLTVTGNITKRKLDGNKENITIKNINLDTSKEVVNNLIQNSFVPLGRKFDPITEMISGFKLSSLAAFKVERFTVKQMQTVLETMPSGDKTLKDFKLEFDDDEEGQKWGSVANDYYFGLNYTTDDERGIISLKASEDPLENIYELGSQGDLHFSGTLDIPALDANLKADFKFSLNMTDNLDNRVSLEIKDMSDNQGSPYSINEEVMMGYYKEGVFYVDTSGLISKFLGQSIDLPALNFPKLKFTSVDMTEILNQVVRYGVNMFQSSFNFSNLNPDAEDVVTVYDVFLSKARSEGSKVILTIDDEMIAGMMGAEASGLLDSIGETLGISKAQMDLLIALGIFDNSYLELGFDTLTKEISLEGFSKDTLLFSLVVSPVEVLPEGINIIFPDEINPAFFTEYKELLEPEIINLNFDALISTQKVVSADFSPFMGLFMGDVTGKNTPYLITSGSENGIRFLGEVAQSGDNLYINMQVLKGEEVLLKINTNMDNISEVLVDNRMLGIKYRMPGATVIEGLSKLAGGEETLNFENIVLNVPELAKESTYRREGDYIHLEMFPYLVGKIKIDPLKRITGVEGLIATINLNVTFDLPTITEDSALYPLPSISVPADVKWSGMYDATWLEKASITLGEETYEFLLTFDDESATLITGQFEYHPTTYLFGRPVSYGMYFSDQVNGTRIVRNLRNAFLLIDPSATTPMPTLMEVIYQDGTIGNLRYRIEGFPYTNENIKQVYSGLPSDEYEVIIGEGSMAEVRFNMIVEVLNSVLVISENDYYNDIPIVAKITIDPYDYAIKKAQAISQGLTYNPIRYREQVEGGASPTALLLTFESNIKNQSAAYRIEYLENFDWGFDLTNISYSGGQFIKVASYNNLRMALEVTVLAKIVSYIQINDENNGYYTVDALKQSTYAIPATTIFEENATPTLPANEIRIYFESGNFRIVGTEPLGGYQVKDTDLGKFDGFYPGGLDWNHKQANQVTVDRAIYPLDDGKTNITQAYFGDDYAGKQLIRLTVVCPTRVVGTLPDTLLAISEITYDSNGDILEDATRREAVKVSYASFAKLGELGSYFEFDPYSEDINNTRLPSMIYIDAVYRGRMQRLGYNVTWLTNLDGIADNIIDSQGNILNALAEEEYFVVYGRIGTATNYQILTMIIHNKSGEYESVQMLDENEEEFILDEEIWEDNTRHYYIRHLNPYADLVLPKYFILKFSESSGIPDTKYEAFWKTSGDFDALTYAFPYQGGSFIVTTKLSADSNSGMLDQTIELNLQFDEKIVVPDIIFGVSTGMTPGHIILDEQEGEGGVYSVPYVPVDTYTPESSLLYQSLADPNLSVGVQFQDETSLSSGITIEWDNLDKLLEILRSPLGSRDIYNAENYYGDFIILTGRIEPGTVLEQSVQMAFRIESKVIRDLNFMNLNRNYTVKDENDIIPVHILQTLKRIQMNPETEVYEYLGENTLNITFNKPYMLVGTYKDINGDTRTGVCTPSDYLAYLFSRISVGFEGDLPAEYAMVYELRQDFDEIMFFKKDAGTYAGDESVEFSEDMNTVTVSFTITKLGPGSCEQSFSVRVSAVRDNLLSTEFSERIETFDVNGIPLYGGIDGYTIPSEYGVEYYKSGVVNYEGLVWTSFDYVSIEGSDEVIEPGDIITNIPYQFFRFRSGRIITLVTELQDGRSITRRLIFNAKDIKEVNYSTSGTGIYNVKDGTLTIANVYQVYPVLGLETRLSTEIIPKKTDSFFGELDMSFTLDNGWIPSPIFALSTDPTKFDLLKMVDNINYYGLARTLFATGTVTGYNGEKQPIKLYIQVQSLDSGGKVYNQSINLDGSLASIDPYLRPGNENGVLVIPKDITVKFGEVGPNQAVFTFPADAAVFFQIRNVLTEEYVRVSELTYNKFGHTMGVEFGGPNARIFVNVILPDGNDSCSFEIEFLNRELQSVYYPNKANGVNQTAFIEGRYYIDPYDKTTFTLPTFAEFKYVMYATRSELPITLVPAQEGYPFILVNGSYTLRSDISMQQGGRYFFYGFLPGIGLNDSPQYYILTVIVINRTVEVEPESITANDRKFKFTGTAGVPNPFEALVSDIPSSLASATFHALTDADMGLSDAVLVVANAIAAMPGNENVTTSYYDFSAHQADSIYADYTLVRTPVLPNVKWFTEGRELENSDILVNGGFALDLTGKIGFGDGALWSFGQEVTLQISADIWTFEEILGITNYLIEFNKYSNASIASQFDISFLVDSVSMPMVFYPLDRVNGDINKMRRVIDWGQVDPESTLTSSITLKNLYKSGANNLVITEEIYNLDYQQIAVDEISFGFGADEGYNTSGNVYLILDPLNPVIPAKALARGLNPNELVEPREVVDIGEVNIVWVDTNSTSSTSIYNIPIAGGKRQVDINIVDTTGATTPFSVTVYYLNRIPRKIFTTVPGFSSLAPVGGEYLLMERGANNGATIPSTKNHYLNLDPVNPNVYTSNPSVITNLMYLNERSRLRQSLYMLPPSVRIEFYEDPLVNQTMSVAIYNEAIGRLGRVLNLSELGWVLSKDIALEPATSVSPIAAKIRGYKTTYTDTILGQQVTSTRRSFITTDPTDSNEQIENPQWLASYLNLDLKTVDRMVTHTSISEGVEVVVGETTINYQEANETWYIDPYDIKLPSTIDVYFKNQAMPVTYGGMSPIVWSYDASYLNKPEIISGSIVDEQPNGERFMTLVAEFRVYGTKVGIQFKIKARDIDTSVTLPGGAITTEPIKGGTIYVLKGKPLSSQLPTKLYYRFDYPDGSSEIAAAPLTFDQNSLAGVSTAVAITDTQFGGSYSNVPATLGTIDDNNILFNIIVIDPKLFAIRTVNTTIDLGGSVTTITEYKKGGFITDVIAIGVSRNNSYLPGPETTLLPSRIIITADGDYIEVDNITYDTVNMKATVNCSYTFLSFSDNSRLYGNASLSETEAKKLAVTFELPISKYQYTGIEIDEAVFEQSSYSVPLGSIIKASDLPLTTSGIRPLWVLDEVNTNLAGRYDAKCYFKNAYGAIIEGKLTIVVQKKAITQQDVQINKAYLNRVYSGKALDIKNYITLANFLRADGSFGQLQGYTIQFSIDGGATWIHTQPTNVPALGAPEYLVRIIVNDDDDYNITGSVSFRLVITKAQVIRDNIFFHLGDDLPLGNEVTFEYNGQERIPAISGIPDGVIYQLIFANYVFGEPPQYQAGIRPINAGNYYMTVRFSDDQRNYDIEEGVSYSIIVRITKKNVSYSLEHILDYTGTAFNVPINGLPNPIPGDIIVTYSYYDVVRGIMLPAGSTLRNAGTYRVDVQINGGLNYPSYNTGYPVPSNQQLLSQIVEIRPKEVYIKVGNLSSDYLEPLKGLNSAVTIVDASNQSVTGLQGTDELGIFGSIIVNWSGGVLTRRHMVGSYELVISNLGTITHNNYVIKGAINGTYNITAALPNTRVIDNKAQLTNVISLIKDGDTIRLYLRAGNYGTITLNKNAAVSIVGSYNLSGEEDEIAVVFDLITVTKGALLLDIVKMYSKPDAALITVGKDVASLTVNRCSFIDLPFVGGSMQTTSNSRVVSSSSEFKGTVYLQETSILGFATGLYLQGGSAEIQYSSFKYVGNAVHILVGNASVSNSTFSNCRATGLRIDSLKSVLSIFDNIFISNIIGIRSAVALRNDIKAQNIFRENGIDTKLM